MAPAQDSRNTPAKTRRYGIDNRHRALKTQPLSTRRYSLEWPCSGSSPVVSAIPFNHLAAFLRFWFWAFGKPPSIAEIRELEQVLAILGIAELHADMRDLLLPFLAKTREDRKRLMLQDGFASLVLNAKSHAARVKVADAVEVQV